MGQASLHKQRGGRRDQVLSYLLGTVSEHLPFLPSMRPAEPGRVRRRGRTIGPEEWAADGGSVGLLGLLRGQPN